MNALDRDRLRTNYSMEDTPKDSTAPDASLEMEALEEEIADNSPSAPEILSAPGLVLPKPLSPEDLDTAIKNAKLSFYRRGATLFRILSKKVPEYIDSLPKEQVRL